MNTIQSSQTFTTIHTWFSSVWIDLVDAKATNDQTNFNKLMLDAVPELEKFVASRMKIALKRGHMPEGKFKVNDFINELFIVAYDKFLSFTSARDFSNWLFIKMDALIEDHIVEEDFDDFFFSDFANYSEDEWKELEQKKDPSDHTGEVTLTKTDSKISDSGAKVLAAIFKSDDEREQLQRLKNDLSEEDIESHLELVMKKLKPASAVTFNLVVDHQVDPKDIAAIKQKTEAEIEADLTETKARIRDSFASRYKHIVM